MEVAVSTSSASESSKSYLQDVVSSEVLLLILRLLQPVDKLRLRLTCRRLYAAVSDPAAWPTVSFDYYCTPNRKVLDTTLSLCSPGVRKVEINTRGMIPKFPWVRYTKQISKCASTLTHLTLLGISPSPKKINTALAACVSLSHLTVALQTLKNVWFPDLRSLQCFEVCPISDTLTYLWHKAFKAWSENSFFPRQFCIRSDRSTPYDLRHLLSNASYRSKDIPLPLPPGERAKFQLLYHNGQAFFEVRVEGSHYSIPVAHCSSITSSPLLLVLSTPQSAQIISNSTQLTQLPKCCVDTPFSSIAFTLAHLTLNNCKDVNYESLNEIAHHCPQLKTLSLDSYTNALDNLSGLESISEKCLRLERLSLRAVHGHDMNHILFWSLLNNFRKLAHLAVMHCVLPANCQLNNALHSMEVSCCHNDVHVKTLGQLISTNLRVLKLVNPGDVRGLLCSVPKLQYLYIRQYSWQSLELPTDYLCYQNIEKFHLESSKTVSCDFIEALVHSGRLTHCYLTVGSITDCSVSKLIRAPRMMHCHIRVSKRVKESESKFCKAAKVCGVPYFTYAGMNKPIVTDNDLIP